MVNMGVEMEGHDTNELGSPWLARWTLSMAAYPGCPGNSKLAPRFDAGVDECRQVTAAPYQ